MTLTEKNGGAWLAVLLHVVLITSAVSFVAVMLGVPTWIELALVFVSIWGALMLGVRASISLHLSDSSTCTDTVFT
jgi:hypothetical protein